MDGVDGVEPGWLAALTHAKSVAVVGASERLDRPGGRIFASLIRFGFAGAVYPVHRSGGTIQGVPAYRTIGEVPDAVDVAAVVVPAREVASVLRDCVGRRVGLVMIGAAGFGESGAEGRALEEEIASIIAGSATRVIGPNTNGIFSGRNALCLSFSPAFERPGLTATCGRVAVVSQSGALGGALFTQAAQQGVPVDLMVNTGNELDVDFTGAIADIAATGHYQVIAAYCEGITDAAGLVRGARTAEETGTTIAMLKVGSSEAGAAAAAAHTAKLTGTDRVYEGVLEQLGVIRCRSVEELVDVSALVSRYGAAHGDRVTIATMSGGLGIMLADAAERTGLRLASWPQERQAELRGQLPPYLSLRNPIDMAGSPFRDLATLQKIIETVDRHPGSDVTVLGVLNYDAEQEEIASAVAAVAPTLRSPIVVVWYGGSGRARDLLNAAGVPTFATPERAIAAIGHGPRRRAAPVEAGPPRIDPGRLARATAIAGRARSSTLSLPDAVELLGLYGIAFVEQVTAPLAPGVEQRLTGVGLPCYVKLMADELLHKTDIGAVRRARTRQDLAAAIEDLAALADRLGLDAPQMEIQTAIENATELLVGMVDDATFGPVITLGLGGVHTELLDDVVSRVPPLDPAEIERMIDRIRHREVLAGYRGRAPVDRTALAGLLARFATLVAEAGHLFSAIDLNPVLCDATGRATPVDVVMTVAR